MDKIEQKEQELINKLEKEKLEEVTVYTIEFNISKYSTTNKDAAFKMWQLLSNDFFSLEQASYTKPYFYWKKPIEVKLIGEKKQVWKDYESAQRALNAFKALTDAVAKSKRDKIRNVATPF